MKFSVFDIETWKPLRDYPHFEISNHGNVRRIVSQRGQRVGRIKKSRLSPCGYPVIRFIVNGKEKIRPVHQLVLETFVGPRPPGDFTANHKDGCKTRNCVENLEWCTRRENLQHAYVNGLIVNKTGSKSNGSKLKSGEAWLVWKLIDAGVSQIIIAKMFNIHNSTVYAIKKYNRYVEERS